MIVKCDKENLQTVIQEVKNKEIVYLQIKDYRMHGLMIDYKVRSEIDDEVLRKSIDIMINKNVGTILTLIDHLNELLKIIQSDINIIEYELLFDCTKEDILRPELHHSSIMPSGVHKVTEKEYKVEWDKLFNDKLHKQVPGLFMKKSTKKYIPVTYYDLMNILKDE